jgi:hypothetical protein
MKAVKLHQRFFSGLMVGLGACGLANYIGYREALWDEANSTTSDYTWSFGFPFDLSIHGGFAATDRILWFGLFANTLIALLVGLWLGFFAARTAKGCALR